MLNRTTSTIAVCALLCLAACNSAPEASKGAAGDAGNGAASAAPVKLVVPSGTYKLDPTHAILQWSVSHFGTSDYHARFADIDATLNLDTADIEKSTIKFIAKADSIRTDYPADYKKTHPDTGYDTWDAELGRSEKFMDGTKHPDIIFESTEVEKTGEGTARVTGNLTFRGITKLVTLNVRIVGQKEKHPFLQIPVVGFEAEGEIVRADFGMSKGMLGATAKIYFNGEFHGAKARAATPAAGAN